MKVLFVYLFIVVCGSSVRAETACSTCIQSGIFKQAIWGDEKKRYVESSCVQQCEESWSPKKIVTCHQGCYSVKNPGIRDERVTGIQPLQESSCFYQQTCEECISLNVLMGNDDCPWVTNQAGESGCFYVGYFAGEALTWQKETECKEKSCVDRNMIWKVTINSKGVTTSCEINCKPSHTPGGDWIDCYSDMGLIKDPGMEEFDKINEEGTNMALLPTSCFRQTTCEQCEAQANSCVWATDGTNRGCVIDDWISSVTENITSTGAEHCDWREDCHRCGTNPIKTVIEGGVITFGCAESKCEVIHAVNKWEDCADNCGDVVDGGLYNMQGGLKSYMLEGSSCFLIQDCERCKSKMENNKSRCFHGSSGSVTGCVEAKRITDDDDLEEIPCEWCNVCKPTEKRKLSIIDNTMKVECAKSCTEVREAKNIVLCYDPCDYASNTSLEVAGEIADGQIHLMAQDNCFLYDECVSCRSVHGSNPEKRCAYATAGSLKGQCVLPQLFNESEAAKFGFEASCPNFTTSDAGMSAARLAIITATLAVVFPTAVLM